MNKISCFTLDISYNALFAVTMETGDRRGWRGRGTYTSKDSGPEFVVAAAPLPRALQIDRRQGTLPTTTCSNPMPTAASWDAMDAVITSCEVS
jgi:hypothetical protein